MVTASAAAAAAAAVTTSQQAFDPLVAASGAVLNLVACCGVGVTASKARVLDQQAISALSRLVYNVFQPSLLFTNVLQTLATPDQSRGTLLLLPLAAALQILAAGAISSVLLRLVGLNPRSEAGREARICSTFANAGPLPLLFVDALFKNHPDPTLRPRAVAFISFYLLAWSPLFWNYGYGILTGGKGREGGREGEGVGGGGVLDTQVLLHKKDLEGPGVIGGGVTGSGNGAGRMMEEGSGSSGKDNSTATGAYPQQQKQEECARDPAMFVLARVRRVVGSRAVKKLLNPPTLGCTMGALVGVIPPLRGLFLGDGAPLSSVFAALRTMGSAYVPCVLLVLSGSLAQGLEGFDRNVLRRAGLVMFQRFCLMPALALAMVEAGKRTGLLPTGDPLLIFILLLQACMPSAQNSVLILQLEKRPHAAASMARLISTVYVLSILPIGLLIRALLSYCPLGF